MYTKICSTQIIFHFIVRIVTNEPFIGMPTAVQKKIDVQIKKIDIYNIYRLKQCVNVSNYIYYVKKKTCLGFERGRRNRNVNYSALFTITIMTTIELL